MKPKITYIFLFFSGFMGAFAQIPGEIKKNLVPNGNFENYKKKSNNIKQAIPWTQIATVDYYQEPLSNDSSSEKGAKSGDCYIGLRFQKKYKEFAQVKLADAMRRGVSYNLEMYVRLAFWSNASLKTFGVLFSKGGYKNNTDAIASFIIDTTSAKGGLINKYRWFKISASYKAEGGEKFLTIGNFSRNVNKDMVRMNKFKFGFKEAYYFVDDISLIKSFEKEEKVKVEIVGSYNIVDENDSVLIVKKNMSVGEKMVLKNIFFENGKSYILPESYSELNKLAQYLIRNPNLEIRINGHSDNSGSKSKNIKISEQRAREVFEYLIKKGVQNKMHFKGYGNLFPIASNETDDGKAKNRRVEFEIMKEN